MRTVTEQPAGFAPARFPQIPEIQAQVRFLNRLTRLERCQRGRVSYFLLCKTLARINQHMALLVSLLEKEVAHA